MGTRFLPYGQEEKQERQNLEEIKKEYAKVEHHWLLLHYQISLALVVAAMLCECAAGALLYHYDLISISVQRYVCKYVVAPSAANLAFILLETAVVRSANISQLKKIYVVSLTHVTVSFVLYTAHSVFPAMYYTFAGAVMLTIIYARYRVTAVTAVAGVLCFLFSEFFTQWDPDKVNALSDSSRMCNILTALFVLLAFSAVCMVTIRFEKKRNQISIQNSVERYQLWESVRTDDMTGIFNRKALYNAFKDMEDSAGDKDYILAVVDIDHFKQINDCWGHRVGDNVLISFAEVLRENCGPSTPFRYGGDEFCLLFCGVSMAEAANTCKKIQAELDEMLFPGHPEFKLTASFGLASYSFPMDAARLFLNADDALYEAKKKRDSIHVYEQSSDHSGRFSE